MAPGESLLGDAASPVPPVEGPTFGGGDCGPCLEGPDIECRRCGVVAVSLAGISLLENEDR